MATTLEQIVEYLGEYDINHQVHEDDQIIATGFRTERYHDADGDQVISMLIALEEDGEYFKLLAPRAFDVPDEHIEEFAAMCLAIQMRTKLLQFEWHEDYGIAPIIEFPLEDAELTSRQFHRCLRGMVTLMEEYYDVLATTATEGTVDLEMAANPELARVSDDISGMLDLLPESVLEDALRRARDR